MCVRLTNKCKVFLVSKECSVNPSLLELIKTWTIIFKVVARVSRSAIVKSAVAGTCGTVGMRVRGKIPNRPIRFFGIFKRPKKEH